MKLVAVCVCIIGSAVLLNLVNALHHHAFSIGEVPVSWWAIALITSSILWIKFILLKG